METAAVAAADREDGSILCQNFSPSFQTDDFAFAGSVVVGRYLRGSGVFAVAVVVVAVVVGVDVAVYRRESSYADTWAEELLI